MGECVFCPQNEISSHGLLEQKARRVLYLGFGLALALRVLLALLQEVGRAILRHGRSKLPGNPRAYFTGNHFAFT
jgi:hypothetical protein